MLLVVDANTVFSALLTGGRVLDVFLLNKRLRKFEFVAPEFMFLEIGRHLDEIVRRSDLSRKELWKVFELMKAEIEFIPFERFNGYARKAEKIAPHSKDVQYFAMGLAFRCGIWSKEKAFRDQSEVTVFSTRELLEQLLESP